MNKIGKEIQASYIPDPIIITFELKMLQSMLNITANNVDSNFFSMIIILTMPWDDRDNFIHSVQIAFSILFSYRKILFHHIQIWSIFKLSEYHNHPI